MADESKEQANAATTEAAADVLKNRLEYIQQRQREKERNRRGGIR